jgi:putative flavoprotein involved in K+ transport
VYLAVGGHTRMPRHYRGRDIFWWLDQVGALDRTVDEMRSPDDARREPSLQLVGQAGGGDVDLASLAANGVTLTGRLASIEGTSVGFADDLAATVATAEQRLCRVLDRIDGHIAARGLAHDVLPREHSHVSPPVDAPRRLDLRRAGVSTVIWATGHRRAYPWLDLPSALANGELVHRYGITPIPGLYVLGQRFQRTRRSNFLDGVGADAVEVTRHLLAGRHRPMSVAGLH